MLLLPYGVSKSGRTASTDSAAANTAKRVRYRLSCLPTQLEPKAEMAQDYCMAVWSTSFSAALLWASASFLALLTAASFCKAK